MANRRCQCPERKEEDAGTNNENTTTTETKIDDAIRTAENRSGTPNPLVSPRTT
ncbi:hypothetical protein DPMN_097808 [Dreissena polymorpha]|uniref:Uncharacterized protein n=1 Tax=Dreissena polymorpha TaxID=45954 RepID=A0A9D4LCG4_DREPO|nr:hypothetical protein DPMN_097808 [Dreissena polymorpha]